MEKIPSRSSPVTEPSWLAGLMVLRCGRPSACKHPSQWFWGVVAAVIFAGVYPASYAIAQQVFWTEANSGFSVLASNLDGSGLTTIATIGGPVRSLAVLPGTNQIFWSVEGANAGSIYTSHLNGSSRHLVTATGANPTSLAIDTANSTMYWTDYDGGSIERANLDGTGRTTIVSLQLGTQPLSIAVDTRGQQIYWTENDSSPRICRANLDGSDIQAVVTSGVGYATTLQLDLRDNLMFWTDTHGSINRANLDGTNPQSIIPDPNVPSGLSLDLATDKLYFSEYYTGAISSANLDGTDVQHLFNGAYYAGVDEIAVVPEPGALSVLIFSSFILLTRRRTRPGGCR